MDDLFITLPHIGDLYYDHIYLFYDEPQIFSCKTATNNKYFFIAIPSEDDEAEEWLGVAISDAKLIKAEKNALEIRKLLTEPEITTIRLKIKNDDVTFEEVDSNALTDDLLPERGEFLDYTQAMELQPSRELVLVRSCKENRDVLEVSLEHEDTHIAEIPCTVLSDVLNGVQQLVYDIAYKGEGAKGSIPRSIKRSCQLCATDMFAASVGVRLKSRDLGNLFFKTPLTEALADFNELFRIASDQEQLKVYLEKHNPRVAIGYKNLLQTLISNKTGMKINSASPNKEYFTRHFSTKDLIENLKLVNSEIDEYNKKEKVIGELVGINVKGSKFEFYTTDDKKITGKLSPKIIGNVFTVPQKVEAEFEIKIRNNSFTKTETIEYILLGIEKIVDD